MKKRYIALIILGSFIVVAGLTALIGGLIFKGKYNDMVTMQEANTGQWANVETSYQRRADLIPNLVSTVKGYAEHEKEALMGVIEARSKATSINIDANNLTPETLQKFQASQDALSGALSRLMVTVERYPDLKANRNFLELQSQLEGTENRISVERRRFNETVKAYNTYIKTFPNSLISGWFDFDEAGYFTASEGSENAPKVEF